MKARRMHFMGIGGQGISAVAQMVQQQGTHVTGCDQRLSATVQMLRKLGIPVSIGHSPEHLAQADMLVISPAVSALDSRNPELMAARAQNIPVVTWQEVLGDLTRDKCLLSVSGVHGKGTTTAMLSLMLVDAGLDPTCEIGAVVPRFGANYRLGQGTYFVNEADEFNHNFWHYHPRLVIVTSIEYEHPEFFADYDAHLQAFEHFIRGMDLTGDWPLPPTLILNAGNRGCADLRARLLDWPGSILTYSAQSTNDDQEPATLTAYAIKLDGETSFQVRSHAAVPFPSHLSIHLRLPGLHNIENALAALTAAHAVGVDAHTIVHTLEDFQGTRRRFEIRHQGPLQLAHKVVDVMLIDDYAHHPTAISMTLDATRRRYPGQRLVAVYQPHMYSRTKTFFDQFLRSFDAADVVMIADIFPAREQDSGLIHSRDLVLALQKRPHFVSGEAQAFHSGTVEQTTHVLSHTLRSGDIAVIMGAGDIYTVTESLLQQNNA